MRSCSPFLALVLMAGVLVAGGPGLAAPQRMPAASGRVTYRVRGAVNGTSVFAWSDQGRRFRQEVKGTSGTGRGASRLDAWTFGDGTGIFMHQAQMGKQAMKLPVPRDGNNLDLLGLPALEGMGRVTGKAKLMGKPCVVRQSQGGKFWLWGTVPLRVELRNPRGPALTMAATRVESPVQLPATYFRLPAGYSLHDLSSVPGAGKR